MGAVATIHGQGTAEHEWQDCHWLWQQPRADATALWGDARRVVVLAPHPDDEVLACGGFMRCAVQQGLPVSVVAVTDGEACYPGEAWWTPPRLRQARRQELREALQELGIAASDVCHLGIGDGAVTAHEEGLQHWLQQFLQPDDLLLVPWRFDGHPDHEAAGRAGCAAARHAGCERLEYPVWGWHWLDPAFAHVAWPRAQLLDVSAVAHSKQRAVSRFRTQTGDVDHLHADPILPPHVLRRFARTHEVFLS